MFAKFLFVILIGMQLSASIPTEPDEVPIPGCYPCGR